MIRPVRGGSKRLLVAAAIIGGATGCEVVDDLLGGGGAGHADRLLLQSLLLQSDHPAVAGELAGAAVATNGALVRFNVTGNYINIDKHDEPVQRTISGSVMWESSDPALAQPASDGRLLVTSTGAFTISVSNPAAGDVLALESNAIVLTVLTASTGT